MPSKNKTLVIIFSVIFLIAVAAISYYYFYPKTYEDYSDLLELRYGDRCSWKEGEERRVNVSWLLMTIKTTDKGFTRATINWGLEQGFIDRAVPLCNNFELLTCNRTTERCECGESSLFKLYGEEGTKSKYVTERSLDGFGWKRCRWAMGTYCVPEQFYNATIFGGKIAEDYGCTGGTSCKSVKTKRTCNANTFKEYVEDNGGENIQLKVLSGEICTCLPDNPTLGVLSVLHMNK